MGPDYRAHVAGGERVHTLTRAGRWARIAVKRFVYAQLQVRNLVLILLGRDRPLVRFTVEADPPSLYVNWRVRPDHVDALARRFRLPEGRPIVPVRTTGDEATVLLTANVYRVSGITNGLRCEWSTYVADDDGTPRYLILEAASSKGSMDPVTVVTRPGTVRYERRDDRWHVQVGDADTLRIDFSLPDAPPDVLPTREWVEANDRIFWRNGIADRAFYDAGFHNRPMWRVDDVAVSDTTRFAELVEPEPVEVVACSSALELVVSPWWNLDDV